MRSVRRPDTFLAMLRPPRDSTSGPSLPLAGYAGTYRDPWYGDVTITGERGGPVIRMTRTPSVVGDLQHWQRDTFVARWRDRELRADTYVTVDQARMAPTLPAVDCSFDVQNLLLEPGAR